MRFVQKDLNLFLMREKYLLYQKRNVSPKDFAGTNVMEVYYNYTDPDGWGRVSNEYLRTDEIHQMCVGLSEVTDRIRNSYSIVFDYAFYRGRAFMTLSLDRQEDRLHFRMCLNDICSDEQVDQWFEEDEWFPYLKEFLTWDEPLPFQLGDPVTTLIDAGYGFEANKKGTVTELDPPDDRVSIWSALVEFVETDYMNRLYRSGRRYQIDEIEKTEAYELRKEIQMKELYQTCCDLPCDLTKIRSMLESNRYTPTELMHTALQFAEHANFYNFHEFINENGRKPQKGELPIHYLHDLLALFLEFGLDPNGFDQEGENIMFFLGYIEYENNDGYHTADCMRLLMEHGGDPDLEVDETGILATHSSRLCYYIQHTDEIEGSDEYDFDGMAHLCFVMMGYSGPDADGSYIVEMKNGHRIEELRMHEQFTYTIETFPEENGRWIMHIIHKETGEEVAVF